MVLEARYLGFGGTGRNGGQIMAGIGHDLEKIKKDVGEDGLRQVFEISDLGADIIKNRIAFQVIEQAPQIARGKHRNPACPFGL